MGMPKSVIRFKRGNQVEYVSEVDAVKYSISELTRAAMRDVGKYVTRLCNTEAMKFHGGGLRKTKRVRGKNSSFQYWARKRETDLQVGINHDTWYGVAQELGTSKVKKRGVLRNTVYSNIPKIVEIESKYLSGLTGEAERLANMIDEEEYKGSDDE